MTVIFKNTQSQAHSSTARQNAFNLMATIFPVAFLFVQGAKGPFWLQPLWTLRNSWPAFQASCYCPVSKV